MFKPQSPISKIRKETNAISNRKLTLIKSGAPFFHIDINFMIYLDAKYFSVVCLSMYYKKLAVKTKLITMGHFFAKKLNLCSSDIIWNLLALKCQCLKHTSKFLFHVFRISNTLWREVSSPCLDLGNYRPWLFLQSKKICIQIYYEQ